MKNNIQCDCNIIHQNEVDDTLNRLPSQINTKKMVSLFKALGDNTRMKIVLALLQNNLCVCDIACILNMTKSATSHQLAVLKEVGIVKGERKGKEIFYSLDDDHVNDIIAIALVHVKHK